MSVWHDGGTMTGGAPARTVIGRARRGAVVLLALFSCLWLNFITATHHHEPAAGSSALTIVVDGVSHAVPTPASPEQQTDCPICDVLAHSGAYFLPTLFTFAGVVLATIWIATQVWVIAPARSRSHAWQSRAPPSSLQT